MLFHESIQQERGFCNQGSCFFQAVQFSEYPTVIEETSRKLGLENFRTFLFQLPIEVELSAFRT